MKTTKLFATAVLGLLAVGVGAHSVGAAGIDGDPIEAKTKGKVTLIDEHKDTKPLEPGGETEKPVNPGGGGSNTDDPDLKIIYVPDFIFGKVEIDPLHAVSQKAELIKNYDLNVELPLPEGSEVQPIGDLPIFAQVFNSEHIGSWTLTAKASDFFRDGDVENDTLNAQIKGAAPIVQKNLKAGLKAVSGGASLDGMMGDEPINIMTYNSDDGTEKLASVNSAIFGTAANPEDPESKPTSDVSIEVGPGETVKDHEDGDGYTSEITWTLTGNVTAGGNG